MWTRAPRGKTKLQFVSGQTVLQEGTEATEREIPPLCFLRYSCKNLFRLFLGFVFAVFSEDAFGHQKWRTSETLESGRLLFAVGRGFGRRRIRGGDQTLLF